VKNYQSIGAHQGVGRPRTGTDHCSEGGPEKKRARCDGVQERGGNKEKKNWWVNANWGGLEDLVLLPKKGDKGGGGLGNIESGVFQEENISEGLGKNEG